MYVKGKTCFADNMLLPFVICIVIRVHRYNKFDDCIPRTSRALCGSDTFQCHCPVVQCPCYLSATSSVIAVGVVVVGAVTRRRRRFHVFERGGEVCVEGFRYARCYSKNVGHTEDIPPPLARASEPPHASGLTKPTRISWPAWANAPRIS